MYDLGPGFLYGGGKRHVRSRVERLARATDLPADQYEGFAAGWALAKYPGRFAEFFEEVADILDLVNIIVTDEDFTTVSVGSVVITVPKPLTREEKELTVEEAQTAGEDDEEEPESPRAEIHLEIYNYEGE